MRFNFNEDGSVLNVDRINVGLIPLYLVYPFGCCIIFAQDRLGAQIVFGCTSLLILMLIVWTLPLLKVVESFEITDDGIKMSRRSAFLPEALQILYPLLGTDPGFMVVQMVSQKYVAYGMGKKYGAWVSAGATEVAVGSSSVSVTPEMVGDYRHQFFIRRKPGKGSLWFKGTQTTVKGRTERPEDPNFRMFVNACRMSNPDSALDDTTDYWTWRKSQKG